jgi:hypothetical protein
VCFARRVDVRSGLVWVLSGASWLAGAGALAEDAPRAEETIRFDVWGAVTALVPSHSGTLGNAYGFVIGLGVGYADIPLRLGIDFGRSFGFTRELSYGLPSGELVRVESDTMSLSTLHLSLRVAPEFGFFRPYVEAVGGAKMLGLHWLGGAYSDEPGTAGSVGYGAGLEVLRPPLLRGASITLGYRQLFGPVNSVWKDVRVENGTVTAAYRTPAVMHMIVIGLLGAR